MKKKCEHENLEMVREIRTGKTVSMCRGCQRVWKDGGLKFRNEFKKGDKND